MNGSPRRGLARLSASRQLDAWNPDLLGAIPIPNGDGLYSLEPYSIAALGDRVIVGGQFSWIRPAPGGGGSITAVSPLFVFSASSGQLVRPTDPERPPWFPIGGWWSAGHDILARDSGIAVALGDTGVVVLNSSTLNYDAGASAPFVTLDWWGRNTHNGVFALAAAPGPSATAAASGPPGGQPGRHGGAIPRWGNRVAGNVLASGIGNMAAPSATAPKLGARVGGAVRDVDPGQADVDRIEGRGRRARPLHRREVDQRRELVDASRRHREPLVQHEYRVERDGSLPRAGRQPERHRAHSRPARPSAASSPATSSAVSYRGTWRTASSSSYSGGSTNYTRSRRQGDVHVHRALDRADHDEVADARQSEGLRQRQYQGTVDLYASANRYRPVAWQKTWTTSATRTISLVAAGPSSRPRIDLDAFAYVK